MSKGRIRVSSLRKALFVAVWPLDDMSRSFTSELVEEGWVESGIVPTVFVPRRSPLYALSVALAVVVLQSRERGFPKGHLCHFFLR